MQNKANVKMGNIIISTATTKPYLDEQQTTNNERCSKQTQSNPISNAQIAYPACRTRVCRGGKAQVHSLSTPFPRRNTLSFWGVMLSWSKTEKHLRFEKRKWDFGRVWPAGSFCAAVRQKASGE
jgi:hypothetical protein